MVLLINYHKQLRGDGYSDECVYVYITYHRTYITNTGFGNKKRDFHDNFCWHNMGPRTSALFPTVLLDTAI